MFSVFWSILITCILATKGRNIAQGKAYNNRGQYFYTIGCSSTKTIDGQRRTSTDICWICPNAAIEHKLPWNHLISWGPNFVNCLTFTGPNFVYSLIPTKSNVWEVSILKRVKIFTCGCLPCTLPLKYCKKRKLIQGV